MKSFIWRRFNIEVPENWEMLSYSTNFDNGRCYFGDRYQHRLMYRWRNITAEPDLEKMAIDYSSYIGLRDDILSVKPVSYYKWHGVEAKLNDASYSTYSSYFSDENTLIEMIFLTPGNTESHQEQKILSSVFMEPLQLGHYRRWRAFGMDMVTDDNYVIKKCQALPGLAAITFTDIKDASLYDSFERFGMVDQWLRGPVDEWAKKRTPDGVKISDACAENYRGHTFYTVKGKVGAGFYKMIKGVKVDYISRTWRCPIDGRLYCFSSVRNGNDNNLPVDIDRLHCCDNLR
jgi:hypothetical protein